MRNSKPCTVVFSKNLLTPRRFWFSLLCHVFHFKRAAANMKIALRIWNFDSLCAEVFADQIIQVAFETARSPAHFVTPNDELEVDCALPKFLEERIRGRIL